MTLTSRPYLREVSLQPRADVDLEEYPFNIPAIKHLSVLEFHPDITFFVGENGAGKSTLLEAIAIAVGFGPEGGTKNVRLSTTDSISSLHQSLKLVRSPRKPKDGYFLRAETFFNVATYMDEVGYLDGYGRKSLHQRSHGEAFMALLTHKFRGHAYTFSMNPRRRSLPIDSSRP